VSFLAMAVFVVELALVSFWATAAACTLAAFFKALRPDAQEKISFTAENAAVNMEVIGFTYWWGKWLKYPAQMM